MASHKDYMVCRVATVVSFAVLFMPFFLHTVRS